MRDSDDKRKNWKPIFRLPLQPIGIGSGAPRGPINEHYLLNITYQSGPSGLGTVRDGLQILPCTAS